MSTLADLWPPFAICLTAGDLTLSTVRDDDLPALADLAISGVHEPGRMPFLTPWTEEPPERLSVGMGRFHWSTRAEFTPEAFRLELAVRRSGTLVGTRGSARRTTPSPARPRPARGWRCSTRAWGSAPGCGRRSAPSCSTTWTRCR